VDIVFKQQLSVANGSNLAGFDNLTPEWQELRIRQEGLFQANLIDDRTKCAPPASCDHFGFCEQMWQITGATRPERSASFIPDRIAFTLPFLLSFKHEAPTVCSIEAGIVSWQSDKQMPPETPGVQLQTFVSMNVLNESRNGSVNAMRSGINDAERSGLVAPGYLPHLLAKSKVIATSRGRTLRSVIDKISLKKPLLPDAQFLPLWSEIIEPSQVEPFADGQLLFENNVHFNDASQLSSTLIARDFAKVFRGNTDGVPTLSGFPSLIPHTLDEKLLEAGEFEVLRKLCYKNPSYREVFWKILVVRGIRRSTSES